MKPFHKTLYLAVSVLILFLSSFGPVFRMSAFGLSTTANLWTRSSDVDAHVGIFWPILSLVLSLLLCYQAAVYFKGTSKSEGAEKRLLRRMLYLSLGILLIELVVLVCYWSLDALTRLVVSIHPAYKWVIFLTLVSCVLAWHFRREVSGEAEKGIAGNVIGSQE